MQLSEYDDEMLIEELAERGITGAFHKGDFLFLKEDVEKYLTPRGFDRTLTELAGIITLSKIVEGING